MKILATCKSIFFQGQILCQGQLNVAHNLFGEISSPLVHQLPTGILHLSGRKKDIRAVVNPLKL